ncbi:MAG TPA: YbjN domain-containing protein [Polyangia bacterium]|nr:YbjN domain-containing protein [Polyangia bacterium]
MSLFGNRQEANLKSCEQMVESVLAARGLDAEQSRIASPAGPAWGLTHGSAEVYIFLTSGGSGDNFIQVISPVMRPSPEALAGPAFLRRLLELNASELTGAAFGLRGEEVVLSTDRSTSGLDRVEVEEMIRRVAEYADHYDDALTLEFGGTRHADS